MPLLLCLVVLAQPARPDRATVLKAGRVPLQALVRAARENRERATPLRGDALTEHLVRAAAAAAARLPEGQRVPGFLVAVGVGLDTSSMLRTNPLMASAWRAVETDDERRQRLRVLGTPTMHDRHDLAQHFGVSAALAAVFNAKTAEGIGVLKELLDAEPGGTGFSFADLGADLAGIALADTLTPARLAGLAKGFTVAAHVLPPRGLEEGLSREQFERRFGSQRDERFRKALEDLRRKVLALPGYKKEAKGP